MSCINIEKWDGLWWGRHGLCGWSKAIIKYIAWIRGVIDLDHLRSCKIYVLYYGVFQLSILLSSFNGLLNMISVDQMDSQLKKIELIIKKVVSFIRAICRKWLNQTIRRSIWKCTHMVAFVGRKVKIAYNTKQKITSYNVVSSFRKGDQSKYLLEYFNILNLDGVTLPSKDLQHRLIQDREVSKASVSSDNGRCMLKRVAGWFVI